MMRENKLRRILREGKTSVATRLWSTWPLYTESLGATGNFDYMEFVAEYAPFTQADLENMARAAELYEMGSMIKVDFQNRFYVAQKAVASGFQAVNFADHRTPQEVRDSINSIRPLVEGTDGWEMVHTANQAGCTFIGRPLVEGTAGWYGCPNRRFISSPNGVTQKEHIARLNDIVLCFMIEKKEAVDHIEEICSIPGVDMVQFGPADYSMSLGWNRAEHEAEWKAAERHVIETALRHGVQPRCEISSLDQAQYYIDLGVRHFSIGDQLAKLKAFWNGEGREMRDIARALEK